MPTIAGAQTVRTETIEHPRIAEAIREMESAICYMEAAPHDFGGHKEAAIGVTNAAAIGELRAAMAFRARIGSKVIRNKRPAAGIRGGFTLGGHWSARTCRSWITLSSSCFAAATGQNLLRLPTWARGIGAIDGRPTLCFKGN